GKEAHGLEAAFAADAGLLHAAHGYAQVAQHPAVEPQQAGVDVARETMGAADVAGPDRGGQAIRRAIGEFHGMRFVAERHDADHWSEDFFLVGAAVHGKPGDHRGRDEPAFPAAAFDDNPFAAAFDLAAFLLRELDVAQHLFHV